MIRDMVCGCSRRFWQFLKGLCQSAASLLEKAWPADSNAAHGAEGMAALQVLNVRNFENFPFRAISGGPPPTHSLLVQSEATFDARSASAQGMGWANFWFST